jgi:hypothetical protein
MGIRKKPSSSKRNTPVTDAAASTETPAASDVAAEGVAPASDESVASEHCDVTVEPVDDDEFVNAYGGAFKATCKQCGKESTVRTTEERARAELAGLCAEEN